MLVPAAAAEAHAEAAAAAAAGAGASGSSSAAAPLTEEERQRLLGLLTAGLQVGTPEVVVCLYCPDTDKQGQFRGVW